MSYSPAYDLYDHQKRAIKFIHRDTAARRDIIPRADPREAIALRMAMRTGKTPTICCDFGILEANGECDDLLVIAPGGCYKDWEGTATDHLSNDLRDRITMFVWTSGMGAGKRRELNEFLATTGPRLMMINVEALSSVKEARDAVIKFCARRTMGVVDESVIIKNSKSQRTKFILDKLAALLDYRRILSGLMVTRDPMDLFAQYYFLDWRIIGQKSFFTYRARYAVMETQWFGGRAVQQIVGFKNQDELRDKIAPFTFAVNLEDCYDMPERMYQKREVLMTPEQKRVYNDMLSYATAQLDGGTHVTATIVIAQLIRLQQILMGFVVDEDGTSHDLPENRTAALLEIFEQTDEPAIIWAPFDQTVRKIRASLQAAFGPEAVAAYWGGNVKERDAEEARFKNDPACRFIVATQSAGGRGKTWSKASLSVYFGNTYDNDHRQQSEARTQGVGKTKASAFIDLVTPGTQDEKLLAALRAKMNIAALLSGEAARSWII